MRTHPIARDYSQVDYIIAVHRRDGEYAEKNTFTTKGTKFTKFKKKSIHRRDAEYAEFGIYYIKL
jgi:hypothetical protein